MQIQFVMLNVVCRLERNILNIIAWSINQKILLYIFTNEFQHFVCSGNQNV